MNDRNNETMTNPRGETRKEEQFEKTVSILIASVTILAAVMAFLQSFSDTQADEANRQAQIFSIQSMTKKLAGEVIGSYAWQGALQTWYELDLQRLSADQVGDTIAAERYRQMRDQIASFSPLLQTPYFDGVWPDATRYEAELYVVESTRLSENFAAASELDNAWGNRANAFVIMLTLLAVALSLYGLSTTIYGWVRWLFVGLGSSIVIATLLWSAVILILPLPETPGSAIEAYAQGVGFSYQGKYTEALQQFDQALVYKNDYANALYERANAHLSLGIYEAAINDFSASQSAGRDDLNVGWNLGWAYYLAGRFDDAVRTNQHTLAMDPAEIGLRLNQGLVLLTQGRFDNAGVEYDIALQDAIQQVTTARAQGNQPPSSLWFYLEAGAADLEGLLAQLSGEPQPWTQAPVAALIPGDHDQIIASANAQIKRIKEAAVALEFTGKPPSSSPISASTSAFKFGQQVYDDQGEFLRYDLYTAFPYGTDEVIILFDFSGFQDGQQEIWKVYRDGFENPSLRVIDEWAVGESGSAAKPITYAYSNVFIFTPGLYSVDLFIDSQLVRSGVFRVEESSEP